MVRSMWKKAVLGVLASTGLALGQQTSVPPAPNGGTIGRIITVTEMGKPGQKCKVICEWKTADGSIARQVVDLNTGEKMTIVETGVLSSPMPGHPGGNIKSIASRIYHWGHSESSPAGVPVPPAEAEAPTTAAITPEKKAAEVPLLPVQTTVHSQAPTSPYAPSRSSGNEDKNTVVLPATPTVVQNAEPGKPAYTVPRWSQSTTATPATTNPPATTVTQAPVQPAQPSDWHKSWGKLPERAKPEETTKKAASPAVAKNDAAPKPKIDPLSDPLPYTKVAVEEKINAKMNLPKLPDEKPATVAKVLPDALPSLPPLMPLDKPEPTAKQSIEKPAPLPPLPPLPIVKHEETPAPFVSTPIATPAVVSPPAPVVKTLPPEITTRTSVVDAPDSPKTVAPAISDSKRSTSRREKVTASVTPKSEPVGRVVIVNDGPTAMMPSQANTQHLLKTLHDSVYPSQREMAVEQLSECDWKQNPAVVDAMITATKHDPSPTVRAACVRCLGHMHANTTPAIQAVQSLKTDADHRVRLEVQEALAILCPDQPIEPTPE